ncbi:MAG: proline--tRNA ligase [Candidatus Woesearchaeota archaeon]
MAKKETGAQLTIGKDEDFSEWFTQLMKKAELADIRYNIKGLPVYMPWAVRSMRKIIRMWEAEFERLGHEPLLMPLLIPEENFHKEAAHVEGFTPEVFWVTGAGDKTFDTRFALRPTSETALYDMYGKWIRSYKDLPFKRYQSVSVYRHETKMTRPFMRTRELHWSESHNVFASHEDALAQVKEDMEITERLLHGKMALPHIFFKRPQWDKFPGGDNTFAADVLLPSGKVLQLPSTHLIGQNFSEPFDVKFEDKDEKEKLGWITCYGPCHSRNYGALITFHGDDKGLVLPWDVAPHHIVIVPIFKKGKESLVLDTAFELKSTLSEAGFDVFIDDRDDVSPGFKFNHWELKGMPVRIEIGPRDVENGNVVVFRRDLGEKEIVSRDDLMAYLDSVCNTFTDNLREKADRVFDEKSVTAQTLPELRMHIDQGKMVRTCFCSTDMDGAKCAEVIEKDVGAEVRGEWFGKEEDVFCDCPVCGKKANHVVYIAKSH